MAKKKKKKSNKRHKQNKPEMIVFLDRIFESELSNYSFGSKRDFSSNSDLRHICRTLFFAGVKAGIDGAAADIVSANMTTENNMRKAQDILEDELNRV